MLVGYPTYQYSCAKNSTHLAVQATWITRPGKHTKSYWKWPFIVSFPIKHGDFPVRYVSLPEGNQPCGCFWIIHVGGEDSLTNILFYPHLLVAKIPDINVVSLCYLTFT